MIPEATMTSEAKWNTSVDELLRIFRDAITALIPIAERAQMKWKEPDAYDDWDNICAAIYESIVIRSLDYASESEPPSLVFEYGRRVSSYKQNNFISDANLQTGAAFVCLETTTEPFDTSLFDLLDDGRNVVGQRRIAVANTKFVFCRRNMITAEWEIIEALNASL